MPLHALVAATAIAVPLFGHQVADGSGRPVRQPLTFLGRDTLEPLAGAPRLPDGRPELSPDGRRVAVSGAEGTTFFDATTGRRLGAVAGSAYDTVSWLGPRRLLRIGTDSLFAPRTTVTVIDPARRSIVRSRVLEGAFFGGTSRQGSRQVLVLSHGGDNPIATPAYALVLDREGRTTGQVELGAVSHPIVDGRLVSGLSGPGSRTATVYAIGAATGTARLHRLPRFSAPEFHWVAGTTGAGLLDGTDHYAFFAARTGALVRRTGDLPGPVGAPGGYLTVASAGGPMETAAHTLDGRVLWRRRTPGTASDLTVVLRGRVYQQCFAGGRHFARVLDLATGRTVGEVPGVFDLTAPIRGRDAGQVPRLDGELILDPGD